MIDSTSLSVVKEELSSAEIERVDDKKVFDHGVVSGTFYQARGNDRMGETRI